MKLSEVQNFLAVANTGSIRSAARLRGLSPPALAKSISSLEEKLQASLVVRTTRGVVLTEYGEAFLHRARTIVSEVGNAKDEIAQLQGRFVGQVIVGVSMTPAMTIVPDALMQFRRECPDVRVRLVEGPYHRHLSSLRDRTMDFAIAPCPLSGLGSEFEVDDLFDNHLAIVTRPGSAWADARSLKELRDAEWIVIGPGTHGQGAAILEVFYREGLPPPPMMIECESLAVTQSLLVKSDYVCVLARSMLEREPFGRIVKEIRIHEALPTYKVSMIHRALSPLMPVAANFATLVRRHAHYFVNGGA